MSLIPRARLRALDFKARKDFVGWPNTITSEEPPPIGRARVGVWRPVHNKPEAIEKYLKQFREEASDEAPLGVLIDEVQALIYGAGHFSEEYGALQRLGRTLVVATFTNLQEIAGKPREAFALADHFMRFGLNNDYDKRKADELVRHAGEPRAKHGFIYAREDNQEPGIEYASIQEFLGDA